MKKINPTDMLNLLKKAHAARWIALLLAWVPVVQAGAQPAGRPMTLRQCIEYALQNSSQVKTSRFDEFIAQKQVKDFTSVGLPQVRAGFDFQDYEVIPKAVFNGMEFTFGTRFNAKADVSASQLLADGSFFIGLQAIKELVALSQKLSERSQQDVIVNITKAYYNASLNEERMRLLDINIERLGKLLDNTREFFNAGFVEKIDVSRLEIAHSNLQVERDKVARLVELGFDVLKFQMGMDVNETVVLTDKVTPEMQKPMPDLETGKYTALNRRIEFTLIEKQRNLQSLNIKRYQAGKFGTLLAYGSGQLQAFRTEFDFSGKWIPALVFGFKLNVPLFDGLQSHQRVQIARLEIAKLDVQRENLANAVALEIRAARAQQVNAWNTLEVMKRNRDLAQEVYDIAQTKYKEGVGTNLELIDGESQLRQAENNYLTALYDYILASIELRRAKGEINTDPSTFGKI